MVILIVLTISWFYGWLDSGVLQLEAMLKASGIERGGLR